MSGERTVRLTGFEVGALVRAARVAGAGLSRFAIIGGVAVTARLGAAHRATGDLDAVVDDDTEPSAVQVLADLQGVERDPRVTNRFYVEGAKVEVIGTNAVSDSDLRELDELDVLFAGGHRWALETASEMVLIAVDAGERATVPVALPASLVAMKLHAIQRRHESGAINKRSGDASDLIRILIDLNGGGAVAREYASAPRVLQEAVMSSATRVLIDEAPRLKRWLGAGPERTRAVAVEEIAHLGATFVERVATL